MKRKLLTAAILFTALMAQAQKSVTIVPNLKVGVQKIYVTKGEANAPGTAAADVTGEITYKVTSKTSNGYQIDMNSKTGKVDVTQMLQNMNTADIMKLLNSTNIELLTDKKGGLTGIKNAKELTAKCGVIVDSLINTALNQNAELKNNEMMQSFMQKATSSMKDMITEDYLLQTFIQTPSITSLNGKTITDGMVEDGTYGQLFKTKTTYSILNGGKTIVQDTKADVDAPSLKAYMLKIMGSLLPESVAKETDSEQLNTMIEKMISDGTLKMDMSRKATYDIGDDGWVKKLVMEMTLDTTSQTSKTRQVTTLKD